MPPPVVYKPAEIGVWVRLGAQSLRVAPDLEPAGASVGEALRDVFDKTLGMGKGAFADLGGRGIGKLEYRLSDDSFDVGGKTVAYSDIKRIESGKRGSYRILLSSGSLSVKPYAWLVVSNVRLPMGWMRNGLEAGYETLVQEIAARAKVSVSGG